MRDKKNFCKENYILDFLEIDWDTVLELHKNNVNFSMEKFVEKMTDLIDKHMPVKQMTVKEREQEKKPWITNAIVRKIKKKNKLYKHYMRTKAKNKRTEFIGLKNDITQQIRKN